MNPVWTVPLSVFAGAAFGYLGPLIESGTILTTPWKSMVIGALLTGAAAVVHLYQPAPAAKAAS